MSKAGWRSRLERWWWIAPTLAVIFPLLRLFPLDGHFAIDWSNHKWLAAYGGEYLRTHHVVPLFINTPHWAGMPYPVFYGTLFYPLLSILTTWLLPGVVIRIVVLFVTWLQFRLVTTAFVRLDVPPWIARGLACLVTWAIYPLTNLYTRSAISEYVALALLTSMLASWFLLIRAEAADRLRIGLGIGLLFALTAGTHPITALYSLPILLLLVIAACVEQGRDVQFWRGMVRALALPIVLVAAVLAPWVYMVVKYQSAVLVNPGDSPVWYYEGIDDWTNRFFPVPHDPRIGSAPLDQLSTPYLDAQINVPLLVLLVGAIAILMWRSRAAGWAGLRAIVIAMIAFAFFLWISVDWGSFDHLPQFAKFLQIAYRAVAYQNIALLLAAFTLAAVVRRRGDLMLYRRSKLAGALLIGCLALSAVGVIIKLNHASELMTKHGATGLFTTAAQRRHAAQMPLLFYGYDAYATPSLYTPITTEDRAGLTWVSIPVGDTGDEFGMPLPVQFVQAKTGWVATNVQVFPWNHFVLDGVVVPDDDVRVAYIRAIVRVPQGEHTLELRTVADPTWLLLRPVSFAVLALWLAGFGYLTYRRRRLKAAGQGSTAPG